MYRGLTNLVVTIEQCKASERGIDYTSSLLILPNDITAPHHYFSRAKSGNSTSTNIAPHFFAEIILTH